MPKGRIVSNILVVTGSVRPNSVNEKVVPLVINELDKRGANVVVADLKELDMPFYDFPSPSLSERFKPTNENVLRWTKLVAESDGVVMVTPEYNHTMSPVQLNAVDWIGKEWERKPVALVGYGWSGGFRAHITARELLAESGLKARVGEKPANLNFKKDIDLDGTILSETAVSEKISAAVDELLEMTEER